jgi:hypothetical protein
MTTRRGKRVAPEPGAIQVECIDGEPKGAQIAAG